MHTEGAGNAEVPPTDFALGVQRLFGVLDVSPPATGPHYYAAAWDAQQHGRMAYVATMTAIPTGARRKARFGRLHEAQAAIVETIQEAGETREKFVWVPTDPQEPTAPVHIEAGALALAAGYQPLTASSITETLLKQAKAPDDYAALAQALHDRGMKPPLPFTRAVSSLIYGMLSEGTQEGADAELAYAQQAQIRELIRAAAAGTFDLTGHSKGYLTSYLLQTISHGRTHSGSEVAQAADAAAGMLEAVLRGKLSPDIQALYRVFTTTPIYRYPFATEQLHGYLLGEGRFGETINIFSRPRLTFVREYMASVLQQGKVLSDPDLLHFLQANDGHPVRVEQRQPQARLFQFMDGLLHLVSSRESTSNVDTRLIVPQVRALANVPTEFRLALERLHGSRADMEPAQAAFDTKCVQIVQAVLKPVIGRRLGGRAVVDEGGEISASEDHDDDA